MTTRDEGETVKAVDVAFDVVDALQEHGTATQTEIADTVGISTSTAHRHLNTLERNEYVVRDGGKYRLSLRFLQMGRYVRGQNSAYVQAKSIVEELADRTDERVQFSVEEHGRVLSVHQAVGKRGVPHSRRGWRYRPIHATASGKAILAYLPEERRDEILAERLLDPVTEHTVTDADELRAELAEIRERGWSYDDQEYMPQLRAVAVPVTRENRVVGALSVSAPTHRLADERFHEEVPRILQGAANEIELNLAFS